MPSSRRISKAEKSLISICVLAVLPLAAVVYVAAGRDTEPKWDISPIPTPPTPNGYDLYVAAANATVRFKPEVDPISDVKAVSAGSAYALKNYSLKRRQQWLKANSRLFALLGRGLSTPSQTLAYAQRPVKDSARLRQLARDITARTRTFQMAHQLAKATMSALDVLQMGQDTSRGGSQLPRLVCIQIASIGRGPLEDWNKTINSLNATEARTATKRLEAILAREPKPAQTLTIDKRDNLINLRLNFGRPDWRGSWSRQQPLFSEQETFSDVWKRQIVSKQALYDSYNQLMDAAIANAGRPYSQLKTAAWPTNLDGFPVDMGDVFDRYLRNEARNTTSNNMLLLRLALRAYTAEHGTAPPALSSLMPVYLSSIPSDVYNDGNPLFYKPQGKNYKLWSVGPDGVNDAGVPLIPHNGKSGKLPVVNTLFNKGDFVAGLCR